MWAVGLLGCSAGSWVGVSISATGCGHLRPTSPAPTDQLAPSRAQNCALLGNAARTVLTAMAQVADIMGAMGMGQVSLLLSSHGTAEISGLRPISP